MNSLSRHEHGAPFGTPQARSRAPTREGHSGLLTRAAHSWLDKTFAESDVVLDGARPWDPRLHDERILPRLILGGSLAVGESYVDGDWDCDRLDELFYRVLRGRHRLPLPFWRNAHGISARLMNLQSRTRARQVARRHYDIDNDLFGVMLGKTGQYSCGYWREATSLDEAQTAKLRLVCEKLGLEPGMRVLDIGCGWGGAARFAAEHYGVEVVGVTISEEQAEAGRSICRGLPVEIELCDYRRLEGTFDRIFSVGMFEHVGRKNHRRFLRIARDRLAPDGLMLLHTIGSLYTSASGDPWLDRYIFPNGLIPSAVDIARAAEGLFVVEDWHSFGADYDKTLMAWHRNFEAQWPRLSERYDEHFRRLWRYYLLCCAGAFRARVLQLWQLVLSPNGVPGGYRAPR